MMKTDKEGIMKLPSELKAKYGEAVIIKQLMDAGVDPRTIKSEKQLIGVLDSIDAMRAQRTTKPGTTGIMKTKEAELFDLQGNRLDPDKKITGGTQETEDMIKKKLEKQNKESIEKIKERKFEEAVKAEKDKMAADEDYIPDIIDPDDFAIGGRVGFKGGADMSTVADSKGKVGATSVSISPTGSVTTSKDKGPDPVDDRSTFEQMINQRNLIDKPKENPLKTIVQGGADFNYLRNLYKLNPQGIASSFLLNRIGNILFPDSEEKADGGRIGFKKGMDRRTFMKIMGGLASIPILGRYFKGAEKAAPVIEKATETVTQAPSYFFDLVAKIKMFGKQSKVGPSERVEEYSYIGKNGDEYTLTEDIVTGDAQITKDKMGIGTSGDKTFDTINDRTVLEYKAPKKDVDPDAERFIDEAAEYEEYKIEFDPDGTQAGADAIDEIVQKEIIEEAKKSAPPIKKAAGGLAYMLGE